VAWELAVTDLANGNGAIVSIGAGSGVDFNVERSEVAVSSYGAWTVVNDDPLSGSGNLTVSGLGYYRWRIVDAITSAVLAPVVPGYLFQTATAEGDSVYERCLTMLRDRIEGLGLTTKEGTELPIVIRQAGDNNQANISYPCILLGFIDQAESDAGGNSQNYDYAYPVLAQVVERTQWHADANRARYLQWRERIHVRTNQQRWDFRVPEVWKVECKPGAVISAPESKDRLDYREGLLAFQCFARHRKNTA